MTACDSRRVCVCSHMWHTHSGPGSSCCQETWESVKRQRLWNTAQRRHNEGGWSTLTFETKEGGLCSINGAHLQVDFSDFTHLLSTSIISDVLFIYKCDHRSALDGQFCTSLLGIQSLSVSCSNCQNVAFAFSESWLTRGLFTEFSEWHRNSKQGWQINLSLRYCSLFGCSGYGESADVADGTEKLPGKARRSSKLLISLKCNIQKRQGRNQGPTTAKGFRKPKISTTFESAKVFRPFTS